ncbi:DUF5677 domain-containing protein [Streptomyces chrestomyceticus]|uniref:DUF5677 domain-containing protein n=1 Tax=Streptomyces chrestomyceticus TaxID=68185 RepID=UPI0036D0CA8A
MNRFQQLLHDQVRAVTGDTEEERRPLAEWQRIFEEAQDQLIRDIEQLAPDVMTESRRAIRRGRKRRTREIKHAERSHLKKLGKGFRQLEEAVILAEVGNRQLFDAFALWLKRNDKNDNILASSIGAPEVPGGPAVRVLTFLGLHARGCTLTSEILLLSRNGFTKGAHSRTRSLYELTTILAFLAVADSPPYVLTERYSLSGLVEARRDLQGSEETDPFDESPGLEDAIRSAWGDRFFKPYGWAIPGIGDGEAKQVTFRDIERVLGDRDWRHAYLTMNHSVHAGAASIVSQLDHRVPFRYRTGSTVDHYDASWVLSVVALLFEGLQIPLFMGISNLLEADLEIKIAPIINLCTSAKEFFDDYIDDRDALAPE